MLYPLFWLFFSSVKPNDQIFTDIGLIPEGAWQWGNYLTGWSALPRHTFGTFFINSFTVVILVVLGTVISTSMAGYAFARLDFPFKKTLFAILMGTLMLPQQVLLVPRYVLFSRFGWINSYLPLTVPAFAAQFAGGFFIYLMIQFIRGIPREIDEAARIDGAGYFGIFWHIIIPNAKPALFSVGLFAFMWSWNDFLSQLLYINDVGKFTVPLGLRLFLDNTAAVSWGALFAMSLLALVPSITLFFLAQKHFVEGISTTGIKG